MAFWYRRFIPNFFSDFAPSNLLLQKKQHWFWSNDQNSAVEEIRTCLTKAPILSGPDFSIPFELQTDASTSGLGAVLTQKIN